MGFHICQFCDKTHTLGDASNMAFSPLSSVDVTLMFKNGHNYQLPHEGLLHYVVVHNYKPPQEFVKDVMSGELLGGSFMQTKGMPILVGYLTAEGFTTGEVPHEFVVKLLALIEQTKSATTGYNYRVTRGA